MQGYELKFKVYADKQEEADAANDAIKLFISELAMNGIAVTANKISSAINRWKDNVFVTNYFK